MSAANWKRRSLVVEGTEDKHAVGSLLRRHGIEIPRFDEVVVVAGSEEEATERVGPLWKGGYTFGVIVDADLEPGPRWIGHRDRLRRLGLVVPDAPDPSGLVVSAPNGGQRAGLWLMPDNAAPGELEDFIATLVPSGDSDAVWCHADVAVSQAREFGAPIACGDQMKGRIHTWLAWQQEPGQSMGAAITSRALADRSPVADRFVAWFRRLFLPAS